MMMMISVVGLCTFQQIFLDYEMNRRLAKYVARMGQMTSVYKKRTGKPEEEGQFGRPRHR